MSGCLRRILRRPHGPTRRLSGRQADMTLNADQLRTWGCAAAPAGKHDAQEAERWRVSSGPRVTSTLALQSSCKTRASMSTFAPNVAPNSEVVNRVRSCRVVQPIEKAKSGYSADRDGFARFWETGGLPFVDTNGQMSARSIGTSEAGANHWIEEAHRYHSRVSRAIVDDQLTCTPATRSGPFGVCATTSSPCRAPNRTWPIGDSIERRLVEGQPRPVTPAHTCLHLRWPGESCRRATPRPAAINRHPKRLSSSQQAPGARRCGPPSAPCLNGVPQVEVLGWIIALFARLGYAQ